MYSVAMETGSDVRPSSRFTRLLIFCSFLFKVPDVGPEEGHHGVVCTRWTYLISFGINKVVPTLSERTN